MKRSPIQRKTPKRHRVVINASDLRSKARGQYCQVRIPGICNGNPETTVLAHFRMAGLCGVGTKPSDLCAAYACSDCHDAIDGRVKTNYSRDELRLMHAEGVMRTINIILEAAK